MSKKDETKSEAESFSMAMARVIFGFFSILLIIGVFIAVTSGPAGCSNSFTAWKASAYGSDWLVVQYTNTGEVMNSWELKNCAIQSESHSDGIYFTTDEGVVHLSGHYVYVQNPTVEAKKKFLKAK
jgi:hypothetical protein